MRALARASQAVGVLVLISAVALGAESVRFYTAEPRITTTFVSDHDAALGAIPEEDKAWPLYRELAIQLARVPEATAPSLGFRADWTRQQAEMHALLMYHRELLDLARRAAAKPVCAAPLDVRGDTGFRSPRRASTREGPSAPREELAVAGANQFISRSLHWVTLALAQEAAAALDFGDTELFRANVEAILAVARHAREQTFAMSNFFASWIFQTACRTIIEGVHRRPGALDEPALRDLAHAVSSSLGDGAWLTADLTMERWIAEDAIQRIYSDDGRGGGRVVASGFKEFSEDWSGFDVPDFVAGLVIVDRREMSAHVAEVWDKIELATRAPYWEFARGELEPVYDSSLYDDPMFATRYHPALVLSWAYHSVVQEIAWASQLRDAALTALAIESYRLRHGAPPAKLADLVPSFMPRQPLDHLNGAQLLYRPDGDSYVLYSRGLDGDDDGGAPERHIPYESRRQFPFSDDATDGDWILFPTQPSER